MGSGSVNASRHGIYCAVRRVGATRPGKTRDDYTFMRNRLTSLDVKAPNFLICEVYLMLAMERSRFRGHSVPYHETVSWQPVSKCFSAESQFWRKRSPLR